MNVSEKTAEQEYLDAALEMIRSQAQSGREPFRRALAWQLRRRYSLTPQQAEAIAAQALRTWRTGWAMGLALPGWKRGVGANFSLCGAHHHQGGMDKRRGD